jgi:hypothetical protein
LLGGAVVGAIAAEVAAHMADIVGALEPKEAIL